MALYEYLCEQCGERVEVQQRITDAPLTTCTHCAGRVTRVIYPATLSFQGLGWTGPGPGYGQPK